MGVNPIFLVFPVGIASSYAFMLPVATAANALAFSFKRITIIDMAS
jgi:sodium-dependent dicarboxylate transporter 2/3/5